MSTSLPRVGVIGLGAMGARLASNLLEDGYPVLVHNRTRARADALVEAGATFAATPREVAEAADLVMVLVTDDAASRAIWLDPERGVLAASARPITVASSTLTPGWVAELAAAAQSAGFDFLEAPVIGTRPHVEGRKVTYLVGGEADVLERARPVLERSAAAIHHIGAPGRAMVYKLAVNAMFATQISALAEALACLEREGESPEHALAMLSKTPVMSPVSGLIGAKIVAGNDAPNFPVSLVAKDLFYWTEQLRSHGLTGATHEAALSSFDRALRAGHGDLDIGGVRHLHTKDA